MKIFLLQTTSEPTPGLFLYENFISEDEEAMLLRGLDHMDNVPWKSANFNGLHLGKRWGVHCNLRDRRVDAPDHPLPTFIQEIILSKLRTLPPMKGCIPNEANAIDYRRRQGHWLEAHVDDRKLSKEPIANISLAGDCYMIFRNQAMHRNLAVKEQRILLKRRCLQVLTGKARYDFSHGISLQDLLEDRRVSITLRESPLTMQPVSTRSVQTMWNKKEGTTK
jgi:alkylated DNA repair dioxygenase AlkB